MQPSKALSVVRLLVVLRALASVRFPTVTLGSLTSIRATPRPVRTRDMRLPPPNGLQSSWNRGYPVVTLKLSSRPPMCGLVEPQLKEVQVIQPTPQVRALSLEELSQSFEVLVGKRKPQDGPQRLLDLRPEDWSMLSQLLVNLQIQKQGETLH